MHGAGLIPVLNQPGELARYAAFARQRGERLPAALQIDTGMCRLGFAAAELEGLDPGPLDALELVLVMSHLAVRGGACPSAQSAPARALRAVASAFAALLFEPRQLVGHLPRARLPLRPLPARRGALRCQPDPRPPQPDAAGRDPRGAGAPGPRGAGAGLGRLRRDLADRARRSDRDRAGGLRRRLSARRERRCQRRDRLAARAAGRARVDGSDQPRRLGPAARCGPARHARRR